MAREVRLSSTELDELVAQGQITPEQRDALLRHDRTGDARLSLTTAAYYLGGFIVFLTYFSASFGVFMAGGAGPLAWGLLTIALTGAAGLYLWHNTSARLAGQALLLVAGSLVPYVVFTLFYMAGLLDGGDSYEEFINNVQPSFLTATAVTAALLVAALVLIRAPLPTAVLAAIMYLLILDLAAWVGVRVGSSGYVEGVMAMLFAIPLGLATLWLERRAQENYAFWLGLAALASASTGLEIIGGTAAYRTGSTLVPIVMGLLAAAVWIATGIYTQMLTQRGTENVFYAVGSLFVLIGVAVPCFLFESHAVNVAYLLANLALIVLGVELRRRLPAAIGALGVYVYLSAESGTLFGDNAPWFMTAVGVGMIVAALFYERQHSSPDRQAPA